MGLRSCADEVTEKFDPVPINTKFFFVGYIQIHFVSVLMTKQIDLFLQVYRTCQSCSICLLLNSVLWCFVIQIVTMFCNCIRIVMFCIVSFVLICSKLYIRNSSYISFTLPDCTDQKIFLVSKSINFSAAFIFFQVLLPFPLCPIFKLISSIKEFKSFLCLEVISFHIYEPNTYLNR